LERQPTKKKLNVFSFKISKFFGAKDFFWVGCCAKKIILIKYWPFTCQKSPTYSICGKYIVEAFCNAIMLKSCVSF
jgi:hypothetical protein